MDPRIRRRRIEVRRREGRRRLRLLLTFLGAVAISVGGWLAVRSPLLDVDHLEVEGADHTPAAEVARAAGLRRGMPMVGLDEKTAARRAETLPWVDRARVRRSWPGRVTIVVEERVARAVTRTDAGSWAVLDVTGRVLAWQDDPAGGLVPLEGAGPVPEPGGTVEAAGDQLTVIDALPPALAARTAAVVAVGNGEIELRLVESGTVKFGTADDIAAKVRAIETILASVDTRRLSTLDVRLPSSPVLTRG